MLGDPSPVQADVKEGESLSLRAEFDAYPVPTSLSWTYNGKQLLNTTEHVITVHRRKYRYGLQTLTHRKSCIKQSLRRLSVRSDTSASSGW